MRERNLDFLRIISMLFVVGLHFLNYGGYLYRYSLYNQRGFCFTWSLEALFYLGVNIFVILTGYFMCSSHVKIDRMIFLACNVWVYSILGLLVAVICKLFSVGINISVLSLIHTVTPIVSGDYWFITSYFILMLFVQFINFYMDKITKKTHERIIVIGLFLFSVIPTFIPWCDINIFLNGGASPIWFGILYITGAYFRKYDIKNIKKSNKFMVCCLAINICIVFIAKCAIQIISTLVLNQTIKGGVFYHHNNIFIYIGSCLMFILFSRINKINGQVCSIIDYVTPSLFSVYLIHDNIYIKQVIWHTTENIIGENVVLYYILTVPLIVLIFVICIFADKVICKFVKGISNLLLKEIKKKGITNDEKS